MGVKVILVGGLQNSPLVSVDTAANKAVEFAIAKEFVRLESDRLYLNEGGEELFAVLEKN